MPASSFTPLAATEAFRDWWKNHSVTTASLLIVATLVGFLGPMTMSCAAQLAPDDLSRFLWPGDGTQLLDKTDQALTRDRLRGKVVAVTFFDTRCSAPCVIRLLDLAAVARSLPQSADMAILALADDEPGNGAADIRAFSAGIGLDPTGVTLLQSDPAAIAGRFALIRWQPRPGAPDLSPSTIFLFDKRGHMAMRYSGAPVDQARLKQDVEILTTLDQGVGSPPAAADIARTP